MKNENNREYTKTKRTTQDKSPVKENFGKCQQGMLKTPKLDEVFDSNFQETTFKLSPKNETKGNRGQKAQQLFEDDIPTSRVERGFINKTIQESRIKSSGIRHLENEITRQTSKPVRLNLLVVGRKGSGKSSFTNTILKYKFAEDYMSEPIKSQTPLGEMLQYSGRRQQDGVDLTIEVTDSPGYTSEDIDLWFRTVKQLIVQRYERPTVHLEGEEGGQSIFSMNPESDEELIHLTLYLFDRPSLSEEEGVYLRRLGQYTNMVPIHTKGDCLTVEEVKSGKEGFIEASRAHGVVWFNINEVNSA